eukprot:jgi/Tetstr1/462795/TSEL_007745.t1
MWSDFVLEVLNMLVEVYPQAVAVKHGDGRLPVNIAAAGQAPQEAMSVLWQPWRRMEHSSVAADAWHSLVADKSQAAEIRKIVSARPELAYWQDADGQEALAKACYTCRTSMQQALSLVQGAMTVHNAPMVVFDNSAERAGPAVPLTDLLKPQPATMKPGPSQRIGSAHSNSSSLEFSDAEKDMSAGRQAQQSPGGDGLDLRSPEELVEITSNYASRLGAGGFGSVYHGHDSILGVDVAVKILGHKGGRTMFSREAGHLARLRHPNIVTIYAKCEDANAIIMEKLAGSLQDRLQKGDISCLQRLQVLRHVAKGLVYLHRQAVVHRDIKPANILLADDLTVKIADYGLAKNFRPDLGKLVSTDGGGGTEGFRDPHMGRPPTTLDVYSLGVTILVAMAGARSPPISVLQQAYELSASLRPFSDTLELLDSDVMLCRQMLDCRHCFEEWYPVICRMVLALALQCTARDPATRPKMQDVETRLSACLQHWESGDFQLGPDLLQPSGCAVFSTAEDLPERDRSLLSKQLKAHAKLVRLCEEQGLDGNKELDGGGVQSQFATLGGLIWYALEHGVIDFEEMQKYRKCNIRGNAVKHQLCRHQHQHQHQQQAGDGASARDVQVPDVSLADTAPLPQHDPVIRMVRHHRRLVNKLKAKNIVAGMSVSQQKKVLDNFSKALALAVEKGVVHGREAEKLRGIRDRGNRAKHEEIGFYNRLETEYQRCVGASK